MPFFSIVMPVWNRATLVGHAIGSILAQRYADYEIICVDDGSTDHSLEVLARYGAKLNVLRQENRGPGAARNLGVRHARGRYVTFLDSDDLYFPWTLDVFHRAIAQHNEPAFVVGRPIRFVDEAAFREVREETLETTEAPDYFAVSQQRIGIDVPGACIRADVLREVGGFPDQHINAEDADLWMRLGTAPGFVRITSPLVFGYRQIAGSAISNEARTYAGVWYMLEQELAGRYPGGPARADSRRHQIVKHGVPVCLAAAREGRVRDGWRLYRRIWRWSLRHGRTRFALTYPLVLLLSCLKVKR